MDELLQLAVDFINQSPLLFLGVLAVFALLTWKNPKAMTKMGMIVLAFVAIYGIVSLLGNVTGTGIDNKTEMVDDEMDSE